MEEKYSQIFLPVLEGTIGFVDNYVQYNGSTWGEINLVLIFKGVRKSSSENVELIKMDGEIGCFS